MRGKVKAAKATDQYPESWFKGYTKATDEELSSILAKVAEAKASMAARGVKAPPVVAEVAAEVAPEVVEVVEVGPKFPAPDGCAVTDRGYPVTVAVRRSTVVGSKHYRLGEIFRGERAWALWDDHNDMVVAQ